MVAVLVRQHDGIEIADIRVALEVGVRADAGIEPYRRRATSQDVSATCSTDIGMTAIGTQYRQGKTHGLFK